MHACAQRVTDRVGRQADDSYQSIIQSINTCMHEWKAALTLIIVVSIHAHYECMHARTSYRTSYKNIIQEHHTEHTADHYMCYRNRRSRRPTRRSIQPSILKQSSQVDKSSGQVKWTSKQARMIEDGGCDAIHHAMQMPIELVWLLSWAIHHRHRRHMR